MNALFRRVKRMSRRAIVVTGLLLILLPPTMAYASTQVTYAQGTNGVGGVFGTVGYDTRDWNRVYHANGYWWNPFYCAAIGGNCFGGTQGSSNPTYANGGAVASYAYCHNMTDNAGVMWTCQTTRS